MKNADRPAMPMKIDDNRNGGTHYFFGLTKREYFAAMAMQGLCASNDYTRLSDIASDSVRLADFMLAELEKDNG